MTSTPVKIFRSSGSFVLPVIVFLSLSRIFNSSNGKS